MRIREKMAIYIYTSIATQPIERALPACYPATRPRGSRLLMKMCNHFSREAAP